eukprot:COSAG04_NODE_4915_length_1827_cov_2.114583_2_plen_484_part_00
MSWACAACTFINDHAEAPVCEICGAASDGGGVPGTTGAAASDSSSIGRSALEEDAALAQALQSSWDVEDEHEDDAGAGGAAAAAAPRRSRRLTLKRIAIFDLPEPALRRILLGSSDNLPRFLAACACVCAEWRRVVGGSAAYGLGLPRGRREDDTHYVGDDDERARLLKAITKALEAMEVISEVHPFDGVNYRKRLCLYDEAIGDAGAAVLAAALHPRMFRLELELGRNELTAAGVTSLAPALRCPWGGGLKGLYFSPRKGDEESTRGNTLGDAGVAALAKALPPTLEWLALEGTGCGDEGLVALAAALPALTRLDSLDFGRNPLGDAGVAALAKALPPSLDELYLADTGCGDDGLVALAAALPALTQLTRLRCSSTPAATARGWVALASALPSALALEVFEARGNASLMAEVPLHVPGMRSGVAALVAAVPKCPRLRRLLLADCGLSDEAQQSLRALERRDGDDPAAGLYIEGASTWAFWGQ